MSRRRKRSSESPPPIAPPPINPLRRLLRRLLLLVAIFVIVAGPFLIARLRNHDAKVRVLNESSQTITEVELVWKGGEERWGELAPGSSAVVVIPEQAVQSVRLRFLGPDGGRNRLMHAGRPHTPLERVLLSRRADFLIRDDPMQPGAIRSTIVLPRDFNLRELVGLE